MSLGLPGSGSGAARTRASSAAAFRASVMIFKVGSLGFRFQFFVAAPFSACSRSGFKVHSGTLVVAGGHLSVCRDM